MIAVKNITKSYGNGKNRVEVLKGISFSIQEGSFLAIIGTSGSGKTTLLNCISGIDTIDSGEILYGNQDITKINSEQRKLFRRQNIGMVFQNFNLFNNYNVLNNCVIGQTKILKRKKDEAIQIANDTEYGLQAGVFTENYRDALRCANEIEAGTVFVNKQSTFRTDNMPFGGFKSSGVGKEGIKYAVEEMTKTKLVGLNLR